jgi:hypothetical protein
MYVYALCCYSPPVCCFHRFAHSDVAFKVGAGSEGTFVGFKPMHRARDIILLNEYARYVDAKLCVQ